MDLSNIDNQELYEKTKIFFDLNNKKFNLYLYLNSFRLFNENSFNFFNSDYHIYKYYDCEDPYKQKYDIFKNVNYNKYIIFLELKDKNKTFVNDIMIRTHSCIFNITRYIIKNDVKPNDILDIFIKEFNKSIKDDNICNFFTHLIIIDELFHRFEILKKKEQEDKFTFFSMNFNDLLNDKIKNYTEYFKTLNIIKDKFNSFSTFLN